MNSWIIGGILFWFVGMFAVPLPRPVGSVAGFVAHAIGGGGVAVGVGMSTGAPLPAWLVIVAAVVCAAVAIQATGSMWAGKMPRVLPTFGRGRFSTASQSARYRGYNRAPSAQKGP